MKNSKIQIYDDVDWEIPSDDSEEGVYAAIMKVFKYWCRMHPREGMRMRLDEVIRDSKVDKLYSYDKERVIEELPKYMGVQFRLEMLVGEWWIVYNPKIQPSPNSNRNQVKEVIPKRKPIPGVLRHEVFKRDGYMCVECGATKQDGRLHVDHIIPVSQGGSNELSNLQTLCEDCNLAKSNRAWKGGNHI